MRLRPNGREGESLAFNGSPVAPSVLNFARVRPAIWGEVRLRIHSPGETTSGRLCGCFPLAQL